MRTRGQRSMLAESRENCRAGEAGESQKTVGILKLGKQGELVECYAWQDRGLGVWAARENRLITVDRRTLTLVTGYELEVSVI